MERTSDLDMTLWFTVLRGSLNLFPPSPPYQAPGEPPAPSHTWAHSVQWTPTAAWATDWPDRDLSVPKISHSCLYFQSLQVSHVRLFTTPWTAARQAALSITNSQSLLRLMSTESVMPSSHLIPCCPLLLPPSVFPSIRVFSNESALHIRRPKYWSFSFSISPSNE